MQGTTWSFSLEVVEWRIAFWAYIEEHKLKYFRHRTASIQRIYQLVILFLSITTTFVATVMNGEAGQKKNTNNDAVPVESASADSQGDLRLVLNGELLIRYLEIATLVLAALTSVVTGCLNLNAHKWKRRVKTCDKHIAVLSNMVRFAWNSPTLTILRLPS